MIAELFLSEDDTLHLSAFSPKRYYRLKWALVQKQSVGTFLSFVMLQLLPKLPFWAKLCEGVGVKNRTRKRAPEGRADIPSVPVQASGHKKY